MFLQISVYTVLWLFHSVEVLICKNKTAYGILHKRLERNVKSVLCTMFTCKVSIPLQLTMAVTKHIRCKCTFQFFFIFPKMRITDV